MEQASIHLFLIEGRVAFNRSGLGTGSGLLKANASIGVSDYVRITTRFSRRATSIVVQRQCRNTAGADGSNYGHSSADRAEVPLQAVGFAWRLPREQICAIKVATRIWALEGLRPQMQLLNLRTA